MHFKIASLLFYIATMALSSVASAESGGLLSPQKNKYQRCYLASYYTQQALIMRYSGLSRFEIMDFFKNTNQEDIPEELKRVNSEVLLDYEKYIDEAFDSEFFVDESVAEKYINDKKDIVYNRCMVN